MNKSITILFLLLKVIALHGQSYTNNSTYLHLNDSSSVTLGYGNKGWELGYDNKFLMRMQWRVQFRSQANSSDPLFFVGEEDDMSGTFNVQRARLKVGGYAYHPYLKYYLEYDFPSGYLLNWEFTVAKYKFAQLKVGQWKIKYNTERFISSGKQQMVERSISNRFFTFDRQIGVEVLGDIFDGKVASSSYNVAVFNGNGRMAQNNDGHLLYFARYQWNFSHKPMKMSYCDIDRVTVPQGFIAFAYAHNQSAFTRFSSDGGGELPGYSLGSSLQYNINQYNMEVMLKYLGFSFTSESHLKYIDDKVTRIGSLIYGGYVMTGYFFSEITDFVPKQLEVNLRYAMISNNTFFNENIHEYTVGFNWFFKSHLNKLTADFSYIENQDFNLNDDNYRVRLQWDISF